MTWTALHDACEHQDTKKVLSIAQVNEREAYSLDDHNSTPLHIACWSNPPLDVIRALLDAHPQGLKAKDVHGDTPLHIAVSNPMTRVDLVQTLVDACPDALSIANREGLMPLHAACRYSPKQDDTIALLVEAYAEAAKHRIKVCVHGCNIISYYCHCLKTNEQLSIVLTPLLISPDGFPSTV